MAKSSREEIEELEPLGIENPLLPSLPLGQRMLQPKFIFPLGAKPLVNRDYSELLVQGSLATSTFANNPFIYGSEDTEWFNYRLDTVDNNLSSPAQNVIQPRQENRDFISSIDLVVEDRSTSPQDRSFAVESLEKQGDTIASGREKSVFSSTSERSVETEVSSSADSQLQREMSSTIAPESSGEENEIASLQARLDSPADREGRDRNDDSTADSESFVAPKSETQAIDNTSANFSVSSEFIQPQTDDTPVPISEDFELNATPVSEREIPSQRSESVNSSPQEESQDRALESAKIPKESVSRSAESPASSFLSKVETRSTEGKSQQLQRQSEAASEVGDARKSEESTPENQPRGDRFADPTVRASTPSQPSIPSRREAGQISASPPKTSPQQQLSSPQQEEISNPAVADVTNEISTQSATETIQANSEESVSPSSEIVRDREPESSLELARQHPQHQIIEESLEQASAKTTQERYSSQSAISPDSTPEPTTDIDFVQASPELAASPSVPAERMRDGSADLTVRAAVESSSESLEVPISEAQATRNDSAELSAKSEEIQRQRDTIAPASPVEKEVSEHQEASSAEVRDPLTSQTEIERRRTLDAKTDVPSILEDIATTSRPELETSSPAQDTVQPSLEATQESVELSPVTREEEKGDDSIDRTIRASRSPSETVTSSSSAAEISASQASASAEETDPWVASSIEEDTQQIQLQRELSLLSENVEEKSKESLNLPSSEPESVSDFRSGMQQDSTASKPSGQPDRETDAIAKEGESVATPSPQREQIQPSLDDSSSPIEEEIQVQETLNVIQPQLDASPPSRSEPVTDLSASEPETIERRGEESSPEEDTQTGDGFADLTVRAAFGSRNRATPTTRKTSQPSQEERIPSSQRDRVQLSPDQTVSPARDSETVRAKSQNLAPTPKVSPLKSLVNLTKKLFRREEKRESQTAAKASTPERFEATQPSQKTQNVEMPAEVTSPPIESLGAGLPEAATSSEMTSRPEVAPLETVQLSPEETVETEQSLGLDREAGTPTIQPSADGVENVPLESQIQPVVSDLSEGNRTELEEGQEGSSTTVPDAEIQPEWENSSEERQRDRDTGLTGSDPLSPLATPSSDPTRIQPSRSSSIQPSATISSDSPTQTTADREVPIDIASPELTSEISASGTEGVSPVRESPTVQPQAVEAESSQLRPCTDIARPSAETKTVQRRIEQRSENSEAEIEVEIAPPSLAEVQPQRETDPETIQRQESEVFETSIPDTERISVDSPAEAISEPDAPTNLQPQGDIPSDPSDAPTIQQQEDTTAEWVATPPPETERDADLTVGEAIAFEGETGSEAIQPQRDPSTIATEAESSTAKEIFSSTPDRGVESSTTQTDAESTSQLSQQSVRGMAETPGSTPVQPQAEATAFVSEGEAESSIPTQRETVEEVRDRAVESETQATVSATKISTPAQGTGVVQPQRETVEAVRDRAVTSEIQASVTTGDAIATEETTTDTVRQPDDSASDISRTEITSPTEISLESPTKISPLPKVEGDTVREQAETTPYSQSPEIQPQTDATSTSGISLSPGKDIASQPQTESLTASSATEESSVPEPLAIAQPIETISEGQEPPTETVQRQIDGISKTPVANSTTDRPQAETEVTSVPPTSTQPETIQRQISPTSEISTTDTDKTSAESPIIQSRIKTPAEEPTSQVAGETNQQQTQFSAENAVTEAIASPTPEQSETIQRQISPTSDLPIAEAATTLPDPSSEPRIDAYRQVGEAIAQPSPTDVASELATSDSDVETIQRQPETSTTPRQTSPSAAGESIEVTTSQLDPEAIQPSRETIVEESTSETEILQRQVEGFAEIPARDRATDRSPGETEVTSVPPTSTQPEIVQRQISPTSEISTTGTEKTSAESSVIHPQTDITSVAKVSTSQSNSERIQPSRETIVEESTSEIETLQRQVEGIAEISTTDSATDRPQVETEVTSVLPTSTQPETVQRQISPASETETDAYRQVGEAIAQPSPTDVASELATPDSDIETVQRQPETSTTPRQTSPSAIGERSEISTSESDVSTFQSDPEAIQPQREAISEVSTSQVAGETSQSQTQFSTENAVTEAIASPTSKQAEIIQRQINPTSETETDTYRQVGEAIAQPSPTDVASELATPDSDVETVQRQPETSITPRQTSPSAAGESIEVTTPQLDPEVIQPQRGTTEESISETETLQPQVDGSSGSAATEEISASEHFAIETTSEKQEPQTENVQRQVDGISKTPVANSETDRPQAETDATVVPSTPTQPETIHPQVSFPAETETTATTSPVTDSQTAQTIEIETFPVESEAIQPQTDRAADREPTPSQQQNTGINRYPTASNLETATPEIVDLQRQAETISSEETASRDPEGNQTPELNLETDFGDSEAEESKTVASAEIQLSQDSATEITPVRDFPTEPAILQRQQEQSLESSQTEAIAPPTPAISETASEHPVTPDIDVIQKKGQNSPEIPTRTLQPPTLANTRTNPWETDTDTSQPQLDATSEPSPHPETDPGLERENTSRLQATTGDPIQLTRETVAESPTSPPTAEPTVAQLLSAAQPIPTLPTVLDNLVQTAPLGSSSALVQKSAFELDMQDRRDVEPPNTSTENFRTAKSPKISQPKSSITDVPKSWSNLSELINNLSDRDRSINRTLESDSSSKRDRVPPENTSDFPDESSQQSDEIIFTPAGFQRVTSPSSSQSIQRMPDPNSDPPESWSNLAELVDANTPSPAPDFSVEKQRVPLGQQSHRETPKTSTTEVIQRVMEKTKAKSVSHNPSSQLEPEAVQKYSEEETNSVTLSANSPPSEDDSLEALDILAREIYHSIQQRLEVEQERRGRNYSGRLPW